VQIRPAEIEVDRDGAAATLGEGERETGGDEALSYAAFAAADGPQTGLGWRIRFRREGSR
jgi:hypothetical protein